MGTKIKVLTLNCWGVPVASVSKLRPERIQAIAQQLAKAEYDIVLLQEIWSQADYDKLCTKVLTVLPYTHYFHSGVIGSGLCIFSKHPITETQGFPFSLNGYPHKIYHADWYGRKAVGLAKILVNEFRINVFVTHLHADYDMRKDEYRGHRALQAFELSQVVKNTSEACDMVIVGGDLNSDPSHNGYRVIVSNGNLLDSWLKQKRKVEDEREGNTSQCHDCVFSNCGPGATISSNPGKRIDYLLYRNNTGISVDCDTCYAAMQKVPDESYDFSDHKGVAAVYSLRRNITALSPQRQSGEIEKNLLESQDILDSGIRKVKSDRVFFIISMFLCVVALMFTGKLSTTWMIIDGAVGIIQALLTLAIGGFLWMGFIMSRVELAGLTAIKKDIDKLLKSNPM